MFQQKLKFQIDFQNVTSASTSKIRSAKGLLVGQHNASESRYPNYQIWQEKTVIHSKIDFQNVTSASTLKICTSLSKCGLFLESVLHHFLKLELLLGQQKGAIWPSNISFCTLTMYYYYVVLQYVTKLPHCGDGRREQRPAQPKPTKSLVLRHSSK